MKILIADDNADLGSLLAGILRGAGAAVDVCQDADVAINRTNQNHYDAIIVEPCSSAGFRPLLDHLATHQHDGLHSVVVATTETDADSLTVWRNRGVFRILQKPLSISALRTAALDCAREHDRLTRLPIKK